MVLQNYINKFYILIISIFLLTSCGIIGGKDDVDATENAVLSGPPLAIPPEFDINSQNTDQEQSMQTYDLETMDQGFEDQQIYESNENTDIFSDEVPAMTNIENSGEIQSFENFNPSVSKINKQKNININPRVQKTYRSTVPSDAYDFGKIQPKNRNTSYVKRNNNNYGFGQQSFEQTQTMGDNNLSKEEEFLLEDLITQEDAPSSNSRDQDIPDFESRGDND
ncbi:MAG: hypothetical protein MK002_01030 [Alphaproteobacteria bacterium]|nr:hypothetical protein [Alphaproteobacteria bacterium]